MFTGVGKGDGKAGASSPLENVSETEGDGHQSPTHAGSPTGLTSRGRTGSSGAAGRVATVPPSGSTGKRKLSPQPSGTAEKKRAMDPERAVDALVQMHETRSNLCQGLQKANSNLQFDANQVVDVSLEQGDGGFDTVKVKLLGGQTKVGFLFDDDRAMAGDYDQACQDLPERTADLDMQLAAHLLASSGDKHAQLERACRQELTHVQSEHVHALARLAGLAPQKSDDTSTQDVLMSGDVPCPARVDWHGGLFTLRYTGDQPATHFDAAPGARTDQAIECLALQQRQAILAAALDIDQAKGAALQALARNKPSEPGAPDLPANADIAHYDARSSIVKLAAGSATWEVRLDLADASTAAPANQAIVAYLNRKAAHGKAVSAAKTALKRCRPMLPGLQIKPAVARMLAQGDDDGNPYTALTLYQKLINPPAGTTKTQQEKYRGTFDVLRHFDRYLENAQVSLSQALSRPSAFADHTEAALHFERGSKPSGSQKVTSATLGSETSSLNKLRNLAIGLPARDTIVANVPNTGGYSTPDWARIDVYFDGDAGAPTFLQFNADARVACNAACHLLESLAATDRKKAGALKSGLVALLCRAHPDQFPHALTSDLAAWSREAQHADKTRQQVSATGQVIAIHLVGQGIEYAEYRRHPDRYRTSMEKALAAYTSTGELKTALDLIEKHRLPQGGVLPLQPPVSPVLSAQTPTTEAAASSSSSSSAGTKKQDFDLIYYRNFGKGAANWRGAWTQAAAGKVDKAAFSHPEADDADVSEQGLSVKALHLKKQVGGQGHWSLFAECSPDSLMIKMDLVEKGYRVYVGAKSDSAYETETFNVQDESLTVKDVYRTMSRVAGEIGGWQDNEQRNCRGFARSMIAELEPMLSDPTTSAVRTRKPPERFDPAKGT